MHRLYEDIRVNQTCVGGAEKACALTLVVQSTCIDKSLEIVEWKNRDGKLPEQEEGTPDGAREMIYTVDSSGNLKSLESRDTLHLAKSSKLHAAVIGMIHRQDGKYLLQWRASNKLGGARLDVSATTHIRVGENYETAVERSFQNELRIYDHLKLDHLFDFTYQEELGLHKENEFCKVFKANYDGSFDPNPKEIDRIEFMNVVELKDFIKRDENKATKWLRETANRM